MSKPFRVPLVTFTHSTINQLCIYARTEVLIYISSLSTSSWTWHPKCRFYIVHLSAYSWLLWYNHHPCPWYIWQSIVYFLLYHSSLYPHFLLQIQCIHGLPFNALSHSNICLIHHPCPSTLVCALGRTNTEHTSLPLHIYPIPLLHAFPRKMETPPAAMFCHPPKSQLTANITNHYMRDTGHQMVKKSQPLLANFKIKMFYWE